MKNIFSQDGVIWGVFTKLSEIMYVSILWFVFSIPIVTIGAANCGLYYAIQKSVRNHRGYVTKEFWYGFRDNFKQATLGWLIFLSLCGTFSLDVYLVSKWDLGVLRTVFLTLFTLIILILVCWSFYFFPYVCRFEGRLWRCMKNAGLIALGQFSKTIMIFFLFLAALLFCGIFLPAVAFIPGIYVFLKSGIQEKIFCKFMSEEDRQREDERNTVFYN